jgi:molecular chaperone GrpE
MTQEEARKHSTSEDVEALKQALGEEKAKAEANLAGWQRAQADFTNYKRRSEQERGETIKFANTTLMLSLLPILDDLERAFAAIPPRLVKAGWVNGIRLIERKLRTSHWVRHLTQAFTKQ